MNAMILGFSIWARKKMRLYFRLRAHQCFEGWICSLDYPKGTLVFEIGELNYQIGVLYSEIANSLYKERK